MPGPRRFRSYAPSAPVPYTTDPTALNATLLAWDYDPIYTGTTGTGPTAAIIYLTKIPIPRNITATNLVVYISQLGNTYTNTQLGLYDSSGTYLSATAVLASGGTNTFGSTGVKTVALAAAQSLVGGPSSWVWGAIHMGTNAAQVVTYAGLAGSANEAAVSNAGTTAATSRNAYQSGHATNSLATIGNLTPSSNNQGTSIGQMWMAIS